MAYTRVNWEDGSTSHNTPISAENLNKMDAGIKELDTNKANKSGGDFTGDISVNLSGDASKPYIATDYENGSVHINDKHGSAIDYKIGRVVQTHSGDTCQQIYPNKSGTFVVTDGDGNTDLGSNTIESGVTHSVAEGHGNTLDDNWTDDCHVEGFNNTVSGSQTHAEGHNNSATGDKSHAEGSSNTVSGEASHAEGYNNTVSALYAHAEGGANTASGTASHAEGTNNVASGARAHAEGGGTEASGENSHAQNNNTIAGYANQTAMGSFNDNKSTNLLEVGNGTDDDNRSNAMEVTADGDLLIKNGGVSLYGLDENKEVFGAKNLLPLTLENLKAINTAGTWNGNAYTLNGVTFTVKTDSLRSVASITVQGNATSNTSFALCVSSYTSVTNLKFIKTNIAYTFSQETTSSDIQFKFDSGGAWTYPQITGNGEVDFTFDTASNTYKPMLYVANGTRISSVTTKVMIRLASDTNNTYGPYAKGNVELTSDVNMLNNNKEVLGAKNILDDTKPSTLANMEQVESSNVYRSTITTDTSTKKMRRWFIKKDGTGFGNFNLPSAGSVGKHTMELTFPDEAVGFKLQLLTDPIMTIGFVLNKIGGGTYRLSFEIVENDTTVLGGYIIKDFMITLLSETNLTYTPYAMGNQELTSSVNTLNINKELFGVKNLLPLSLSKIKELNTSGTWSGNAYTLNGVTFTVNTDGLGSVTDITVNGTKEEGANNVLNLTSSLLLDNSNDYWMTGGTTGINMSARYVAEPYDFRLEQGNGIAVPFERERIIYINPVTAGTYNNVKIYPMIRLATDPNNTYRPYAMSNQELTQRLLALEARVTALENA